jgi:hypothetical protein
MGPFKNLQVLNKAISQKELKATMEASPTSSASAHVPHPDEYGMTTSSTRDARRMILLLQTMRTGKAKFSGRRQDQLSVAACATGKAEPRNSLCEPKIDKQGTRGAQYSSS